MIPEMQVIFHFGQNYALGLHSCPCHCRNFNTLILACQTVNIPKKYKHVPVRFSVLTDPTATLLGYV